MPTYNIPLIMNARSLIILIFIAIVSAYAQIIFYNKGNEDIYTSKDSPPVLADTFLQEHHIGEVLCGSEDNYTIPITNNSLLDWDISDVKSGCSCTTAVINSQRIQKGGSAVISATIQAPTTSGSFGVSLILLNDKGVAQGKIAVRGDAVPTLMSHPQKVFIETTNGLGKARVRVIHPGATKIAASSKHPNISVHLSNSSINDEDCSLLDIELKASLSGNTKIEVKADDDVLIIPVSWRTSPSISLHPNPILIPSSYDGISAQAKFIEREIWLLMNEKSGNFDDLKFTTPEGVSIIEVEQLKPSLGLIKLSIDTSSFQSSKGMFEVAKLLVYGKPVLLLGQLQTDKSMD